MRLSIEQTPSHTVLAIVFCIHKVIDKDIPSNKDRGFLMELVSNIAEQFDKHDWDKQRLMTLDLHETEALACWHCLRICIDNKFIRNEEKRVFVTRAIFILAKYLDAAKEEFERMDKEGKAKTKDPSLVSVS